MEGITIDGHRRGRGTLVDVCNVLHYGVKYGNLMDTVPIICVPSFLSFQM